MNDTSSSFLQRNVVNILKRWDISEEPLAREILRQIRKGSIQWQQTIGDGRQLHLLRIHAPLAVREEVFLGNMLLNDFLFKSLPASAKKVGVSKCTMVMADLESAYFLMCGELNLNHLQEAYLTVLEERLPDLYFASEDLEQGFHGSLDRMLTFYKANIEPFPIFALPAELLPDLLQHVGIWLRTVSGKEGVRALADVSHIPDQVAESRRINVILAVLSFFFARDGTEMQSFYGFLDNAMEDSRLSSDTIFEAFRVAPGQEFSKKYFNKIKGDPEAIEFGALHLAITDFLERFETERAAGNFDLNQYYQANKMMPTNLRVVATQLVNGMQLGYTTITPDGESQAENKLPCRLCGYDAAVIQECHIIGGVNTGKRFNQSVKKLSEPFCVRCATSSYLVTKRLGVQFDGGFPIPNLYNIVFHYGVHEDQEIRVLQRQMDHMLETADLRRAEYPTRKLLEDLGEIRRQSLINEDSNAENLIESLLADFNFLEASRDVAAQMVKTVTTQVISLGDGPYRLFVFVLPQLRPGSKESIDYVQKRFSASRLAAYTLLALLRGLCGCYGPYYFQSLPRVSETRTDDDVFYVQNRPESASEVIRRYGAVVEFARQVCRYRTGNSLLADWILLAERVLEDPLSVFSEVLRASPVRAGDNREDRRMKYNRLSNDWEGAKGLGVVNSDEYLSLYQQLHKLAKEVH